MAYSGIDFKMKNTLEIQEYIKISVERISNYFDVPLISRIAFTARDYYHEINMKRSVKYFNRTLGGHYHPSDCSENCVLYFNVKKFKTIRRLNLTIVHEILHHTKRSKHTKKFYLDVIKHTNKLFDGLDFEKYSYSEQWTGFFK